MNQEFYYNYFGYDGDFDPKFQPLQGDWQAQTAANIENANSPLNLQNATWNTTPTQFQRSSFPTQFQPQFSTIHDGV